MSDFKAPSKAPSKLCLNTPWDLREGFEALVVVGALLKGFLGLGIFEVVSASFLMPDVEGVAGSCLILTGLVGSFLTPLMICLNMLSMGPSAIPSGSSVVWYTVGPADPVRTRFTNRACSRAMGLVILTAKLSGILLSFKMFSGQTSCFVQQGTLRDLFVIVL